VHVAPIPEVGQDMARVNIAHINRAAECRVACESELLLQRHYDGMALEVCVRIAEGSAHSIDHACRVRLGRRAKEDKHFVIVYQTPLEIVDFLSIQFSTAGAMRAGRSICGAEATIFCEQCNGINRPKDKVIHVDIALAVDDMCVFLNNIEVVVRWKDLKSLAINHNHPTKAVAGIYANN
jgi:hypothetical protein